MSTFDTHLSLSHTPQVDDDTKAAGPNAASISVTFNHDPRTARETSVRKDAVPIGQGTALPISRVPSETLNALPSSSPQRLPHSPHSCAGMWPSRPMSNISTWKHASRRQPSKPFPPCASSSRAGPPLFSRTSSALTRRAKLTIRLQSLPRKNRCKGTDADKDRKQDGGTTSR